MCLFEKSSSKSFKTSKIAWLWRNDVVNFQKIWEVRQASEIVETGIHLQVELSNKDDDVTVSSQKSEARVRFQIKWTAGYSEDSMFVVMPIKYWGVFNTGSWSFDYETSAQRPQNVGTHLMGSPHNIHATSAHNEHLAHRWRTQRPHNVHATLAQRPCTVGTQTGY